MRLPLIWSPPVSECFSCHTTDLVSGGRLPQVLWPPAALPVVQFFFSFFWDKHYHVHQLDRRSGCGRWRNWHGNGREDISLGASGHAAGPCPSVLCQGRPAIWLAPPLPSLGVDGGWHQNWRPCRDLNSSPVPKPKAMRKLQQSLRLCWATQHSTTQVKCLPVTKEFIFGVTCPRNTPQVVRTDYSWPWFRVLLRFLPS